MEVRAVGRFLRVSPRKARAVVDLIRGRTYREALTILSLTPRRVCEDIEKIVRSAGANAQNNYSLDPEDMIVAEVYVDEGATLKRIRPRARGMASRLRKRTSHVTVVLREQD